MRQIAYVFLAIVLISATTVIAMAGLSAAKKDGLRELLHRMIPPLVVFVLCSVAICSVIVALVYGVEWLSNNLHAPIPIAT